MTKNKKKEEVKLRGKKVSEKEKEIAASKSSIIAMPSLTFVGMPSGVAGNRGAPRRWAL